MNDKYLSSDMVWGTKEIKRKGEREHGRRHTDREKEREKSTD